MTITSLQLIHDLCWSLWPLVRQKAIIAIYMLKATQIQVEVQKSFIVALAWLSCPPEGWTVHHPKDNRAWKESWTLENLFIWQDPSHTSSLPQCIHRPWWELQTRQTWLSVLLQGKQTRIIPRKASFKPNFLMLLQHCRSLQTQRKKKTTAISQKLSNTLKPEWSLVQVQLYCLSSVCDKEIPTAWPV